MPDDVAVAIYKDKKFHEGICIDDNKDVVIDYCNTTADGPLQDCTVHKSTVLQLACYFKNWDLAQKLFDKLSENNLLNKVCEKKNEWEDTVLHDVSTSNKGVELAKKMLRRKPELLPERNKAGETCVFRAAGCGKKTIFEFLSHEVDKYLQYTEYAQFDYAHFFRRNDSNTILHMAIHTRKYDMALMIAKKYPFLHDVKAQDKWTALQILACSPEAFESGAKFGPLEKLLYKCVSSDEEGDKDQLGLIKKALMKLKRRICKFCCNLPIVKEVTKMKRGHKDALELCKILIETDRTSWFNPREWRDVPTEEVTNSKHYNGRHENHEIERDEEGYETQILNTDGGPLLIGARKGSIESLKKTLKEFHEEEYESDIIRSDEAPLLMATRRGCIEIVKETLNQFPQAVYYLNGHKENLLHVAIKTRNKKIFDYVIMNYNPFLRGQLRALDEDNNSILHMVGCSRKERLDNEMKSPMMQLTDDLQLLESLKNKCPNYLQYQRNNDMKNPGELFAERNEKRRSEAKEWLTKTAEHSIVVITLIATVAFAAIYTVPGGPDERTGYPVLLSQPLFLVFTVTDVLSLGFALTAIVIFLTIITSSFQLKDFRTTLPTKLLWGFTLLFLSMTMMMIAFAATIILTVNEKRQWTKIALYVISFFPVCVFIIFYIPTYLLLFKHIRDWVMGLRKCLPRQKKKNSLPCTTRSAGSHSSSKRV